MAKKKPAPPIPDLEQPPTPGPFVKDGVTYWPLPLGENPGDPHYGKVAASTEKLGPAALITDAGELVLHWANEMLRWHADQIAKAAAGVDPATVGMTPSTQRFIKHSRDWFAQYLATLKDPDASEKDRREAGR